jgi:hypothetical protein
MSLDDVRKQAKQIADAFSRVAKVKGGHAKDAEQLELALQQLPAADLYATVKAEIDRKAEAWIRDTRQNQAKLFNTHLSGFVRGAQDTGETLRETGKGWRVGALELEARADGARCRALYSGEEIVGWKAIRSTENIEHLVRDARTKLKKAEIDAKLLPEIMWEAYEARRPSSGQSSRVKLIDFFEELRIALVRREIKGAAHKRLRFGEFPRWMALYNMDRYLAIASTVPQGRRLVPETGSQVDVQKGLGCLLNGMNPTVTPMNYCYIHSAV